MRRPVALSFVLMLVLVSASAARALGGGASEGGLASARFTVTGASQALGRAGVKLSYRQQQSDDPVARISFYIPKGYRISTGRAPGTALGAAAAMLLAADRDVIRATGAVEVAVPSDFTPEAEACTGKAAHDEFWALRLESPGDRLVIPVFVDLITARPLATFAVAQIVFCLEPDDTRVLAAELTSSSIANPGSGGAYRWRATATPYTPGTVRTNDSGTVELQSIVPLASYVSLRATAGKDAKPGLQTVAYSGTLIANSRGLGDAVVELSRGATKDAVKRFRLQATDARGSYRGRFVAEQAQQAGLLFLRARALISEQDLGRSACRATFAPVPCRNATVGAFSVSSRLVKVTLRAARKS